MKNNNKKRIIKNNFNSGFRINNINSLIIIFLFSILYSMIFFYITPFFDSSFQDIDSYVYRNCAYFIDRGLIVYKDFIDNKGPFLHLINYICYKFGFKIAISILSILIMFFTNIFIYKIAKLRTSEINSLIVVFITNAAFISFASMYDFGITNNMAEFFSLPMYSYLYYLFVNKKNLEYKDTFINGVFFSILFFLRANLCAISIIIFIIQSYKYIVKKEYKILVIQSLYFFVGALIITIPIIIYFIKNNALTSMIKNYIGFNIMYSSYGAKINSIGNNIISFAIRSFASIINFTNNFYILLVLVIYLINGIKKTNNVFNFIIFIFCYLSAIIVSNRYHMHYIWIMMPLLSYPCSLLFDKNYEKNGLKGLLMLTLAFSMIFYYNGIKSAYYTKYKDVKDTNYIEVINYIKGLKLDKEDEVFIVGCEETLFFVDSEVMPNNKYIYQYYYDYLCQDEYYYNDFIKEVDSNPPKIIVEDNRNLYKVTNLNTYKYIKNKTKDYEKVYDNKDYNIHINNK